MAAAGERAEVDTARPFRSVREAVAVFGDRISRPDAGAVAAANAGAGVHAANAHGGVTATSGAKHEASSSSSSSSSSSTVTLSPDAIMAEAETEAPPAVVPMYSAPSSPPSLASPPRSPDRGDGEAGLVVMRSVQKLEAEVAETRREVAQLRKRGSEMEMAVASLGAQLHRGLAKLAEMEADNAASAARRSIGGDTDAASALRSERWGGWGDRLGAGEYLPSFSHALSLGEVDDGDRSTGRRRKAQKVKPIVPLLGDILFSNSKRKSAKDKGDAFYSGDLYGVLA